MAEGRGRAPPRSLLLLVALALLSAPPGSAFALRRRAGLLGYPGELSNSAESRVFQIGRSIRLEHPVGLRRPLQCLTDVDNAEIKGGGSVSASAITSPQVSPPPHHRRHQKSLGDTWNGRGNPQGYGATAALAASPESPPAPSPPPVPRSSSSGPRRRLRAHEACFNGNEVLLVIGVTCAVNFAFILLVLALVHFCNRGASKTYTSSECEWLAGPAEELQRGGPGGAEAALADGAYERVREYVDSLPDPRRPAPFEDDEGALGPPRRRRSDPYGVRGACSMEELLFRD